MGVGYRSVRKLLFRPLRDAGRHSYSFFKGLHMLTQARVKELFDYNPETGLLSRVVLVSHNAKVGDVVGSIGNHGYLRVNVDNRLYLVHRIIWLWVYGFFPSHEIDHKNHDRTANWILNLREATSKENRKNMSMRSDNTSGVMGVHWAKQGKKWVAQITAAGKMMHLGRFVNLDDATDARLLAEKKYGFHSNHGT